MGPAENVVTFTNAELVLLWAENEHGQRACCNFFFEREFSNIPNKRLCFLSTKQILPHIIEVTPNFVAITYCTDANKSDEVGYKAGKKRAKSLHFSSYTELYAIVILLLDLTEDLNKLLILNLKKDLFYTLKTLNLFQMIQN